MTNIAYFSDTNIASEYLLLSMSDPIVPLSSLSLFLSFSLSLSLS